MEGHEINVDRWPIAKSVFRTSLLESEELLSNDDVSGNQPLLVVICHDKCMNLRKTRNSFTSLEVDPLSVLHLDLDYRCFGIRWLDMLKRALRTKMPRFDDFKPFRSEGLAIFARWQGTRSPKPSTISVSLASSDVISQAFISEYAEHQASVSSCTRFSATV